HPFRTRRFDLPEQDLEPVAGKERAVAIIDVTERVRARGPGIMDEHTAQIEVVPELGQPVGAFGKGRVEAVDEDHRFALATLFAGKRTRKIVAEGARFRIVDLFRGDEVGQRVWLAPRRGEANLARLAIRRDRDVDPREPRDLAPRPA